MTWNVKKGDLDENHWIATREDGKIRNCFGPWQDEAEVIAVLEAPPAPPQVPTPVQLDTWADRAADDFIDNDIKMKALALVMADLVEATFNVSPEVARQQVKTRFRNYYRGLLDQ